MEGYFAQHAGQVPAEFVVAHQAAQVKGDAVQSGQLGFQIVFAVCFHVQCLSSWLVISVSRGGFEAERAVFEKFFEVTNGRKSKPQIRDKSQRNLETPNPDVGCRGFIGLTIGLRNGSAACPHAAASRTTNTAR